MTEQTIPTTDEEILEWLERANPPVYHRHLDGSDQKNISGETWRESERRIKDAIRVRMGFPAAMPAEWNWEYRNDQTNND